MLALVEAWKLGGDINAIDENGWTLLYWSVRLGHNSAQINVLLHANADVNKGTVDGITPLHVASCRSNLLEIVQLLIRHNANVNALSFDGCSPLHYATMGRTKTTAVVSLLLSNGAMRTLDLPDKTGSTPLSYAVRCFDPNPNVEILLDAGAKMNNVDKWIKVSPYATKVIEKRKKIKRSTLVFKGILRKRLRVGGPGAAYLGGALPKDMVNLLGLHLWDTRFNKKWE